MKTIVKMIVAASLAVSLTSCLKDDEHFVDFAASGYVAEFPYAANRSIIKPFAVSIAKGSLDTLFDVNIASPSPPTMAVPITVGLDTAALTKYNATATTKYKLLPTSAYQLKKTNLTVAAGSRIDSVLVSFTAANIPATGSYAVPISILTVPSNVTISANNRTQILAVTLKK